MRAKSARVIGVIFAKEMRELLRDRRAVLFAFVLPLLLYPLLFFGLSALRDLYEEGLETRTLEVGVTVPVEPFLAHVEPEDRLIVIPLEPADPRATEFTESDEEELSCIVDLQGMERKDGSAPLAESIVATVSYRASSPVSREALERSLRVLERWQRSAIEARFSRKGARLRFDEVVAVETTDVSSPHERSASELGKMLPFILVILLLSGGAFAAVDVVAGEKERGTLETLCTQAVTREEIVTSKLLVVIAASIAAVLSNLVGFGIALRLGLAPGAGLEDVSLPAATVASLLLLIAPLAVLMSAVLLAVSAFSSSYREAQTYLLPITLAALLPAALSLSPALELRGIVLVVPVGNVSLALREVIAGRFELWPILVVVGSTAFYSVLALRKAASVLGSESVLLGLERPPLAGELRGEARERRALIYGAFALLAVYLVAPWLQSGKLVSFPVGLALTLWGLLPALAFLYCRLARKPLRECLALVRPRGIDLLHCVLMAAAASVLIAALAELQGSVLPVPRDVARELERLETLLNELPFIVAFLLFAVSPAITEELLWRGPFQGDVEARGRPVRTVLIVGVFFGLFHLSLYRFAPTALAGMALAAIRWKTGSVFPCMVFHATYNATAIFFLGWFLGEGDGVSLLERPFLLLGSAFLFLAGVRSLGGRGLSGVRGL